MADFSVRSDSVDVEQIMRQIRARIRDKRGADYTEAELEQLANVKLDKFLDPRGVRSDLVSEFRRHRTVSPEPPTMEFEDTTLYETHRGLLRAIRRVLNPILKLFFSPTALIHALHAQTQINREFHSRFRQREDMDPLFYEVVHNLVVELTRTSIETQNLKMRVESLSSRLDFDERRSRSLENVVQYKPAAPPRSAPAAVESADAGAEQRGEAPRPPDGGNRPDATGPGGERRRRRRRRRRRPGQTMGDAQGGWQSRSSVASSAADAGNGSPDDSSPDDGPDEEDDRSQSSDVDQ